jgi:hypothetical protein
MPRFTWLTNNKSRPAAARKHRARLGVTALEGREVPSAVLANNVLTVTGDDGNMVRNDTIEISSPVDGTMVVRVNGQQQFSGSNAITQVVIDGRGGMDNVRIFGVQSGITDGVVVRGSEVIALGEQNPATGLFSLAHIRSEVRVDGGAALSLLDTASTADRTVFVADHNIDGLAPSRIVYTLGAGAVLDVRTGSGAETFQLEQTPAARTRFFGGGGADTFQLRRSFGAVEINGESGADVVNIADTTQSLSQILGRVTINDAGFQDRVTIDDSRTAVTETFFDSYTATISDSQFRLAVGSRTAIVGSLFSHGFNRTIDLNRVRSVDFRAATREATTSEIDLRSVARFSETQVDVGGVHTTKLGSTAHTLNGLLGRSTLTGGLADSRVILDDAGQIGGRSYRVTGSRITQPILLGERTIDYGAYLGRVEVEAGSANDQFTVDGLRADGRGVRLDGHGGTDSLTGPNQDNDWTLALAGFGSLDGQVVFQRTDTLIGRTGDDTFHFGANGRVSGRIDGGGGFDTLDYTARTTGVTVNLGTGVAASVGAGVANIRNVFGGSGADILTGDGQSNVLVGNGGADILHGATGIARDVVIGGTGSDLLRPGGETLFIGGDVAAADRNNVASMKAIMTEWQRDIDLAARVADLAAGVGSGGSVKLNSPVLDPDGSNDQFIGSSGRDAFYRDAPDTFGGISLPGANDIIVNV